MINENMILVLIPFLFLILPILFIILYTWFFKEQSCHEIDRFQHVNMSVDKPKKLAFLFLIYDEINNEQVWIDFFKNVDKSKYSIYIHYKTYKYSKYFDMYKLKNCIETKWGDISLVLAQNLLIREALKDENNTNFILVSNSCIPFKKFDHVYEKLNPSYSYFNMVPDPHPRSDCALKFINKKYIKYAHQWSILNRKHAKILSDDESKYVKWFDVCPDEHSYISYIYYKGLENELITTPNASNDATTFVCWTDSCDLIQNEGKRYGLREYDYITDEKIKFLYDSPCFFGRKFRKGCKNLEKLSAYIS